MSDWDQQTVIGYKKKPMVAGAGGSGGVVNAVDKGKAVGAITDDNRKVAAGHNKSHAGVDHARLAKIDRENEVAPPPKVAPSVGKAIAQARQAKGITQKDLGTKINEKPNVVQDYEQGKAIPNQQILGKMERALGVKLRGSNIGDPLGGPSKK